MPFPECQVPKGLCISVPSHIRVRLSTPICFFDLARGSVSGADTTATFGTGEDKSHMGKKKILGKRTDHRECDSRKRGGERDSN